MVYEKYTMRCQKIEVMHTASMATADILCVVAFIFGIPGYKGMYWCKRKLTLD